MTNQQIRMEESCDNRPDDEFSLLDYWRIIWKRRSMITLIVVLAVLATIVTSLFMTDTYQAKVVIMPVTTRDSGGGNIGLTVLAQQFGALPGISMPGSTSASEIVSLLKSNILREKMIRQYNLMPVLFYDQWDTTRQAWRKENGIGFSLNPRYFTALMGKAFHLTSSKKTRQDDPDIPNTWDALRMFNEIVRISQDVKQNTITISVDFPDPDAAARIAEYFLVTLTNYMSSEAKRVAATNRKYLEGQLGSTTDPFIKQKTYNMIAQQIEMGMMAEVKENFAFKVIDPPLAPDRQIKPKRIQMALLALFAGLFVGIFAAFIREYIKPNR